MDLFLPRAKYGDSIIINRDSKLIELLIDEVRGEFDEEGNLFWYYYTTGKSGDVGRIYDFDILMNLTTATLWAKNKVDDEYITI